MKEEITQEEEPTNHTSNSMPDYTKISVISGVGLKWRARVPKEVRFKIIEAWYGKASFIEIALKAGVNERTIRNDVSEWKLSDRYWEFIDREWHVLFNSSSIPDVEKFRALTALKRQRMVAIQVNKSYDGSSVVVNVVDDAPKQALIPAPLPPSGGSAEP